MAALESMSRGIPVVASQVGALPTLIHHDINGWLLPVAEREAFIATILQWQSMPVDRQMMMRWHAHDHVAAAFSVDAVLPKMMAVYQQVGGQ